MIKLFFIVLSIYLLWWSVIIYINGTIRSVLAYENDFKDKLGFFLSMILPFVAAFILYFGVSL